jgi:hypothetical protein
MASYGTLRRGALVRTEVSEELSISSQRASVARYANIPSSPILITLMMEVISSSETSLLPRATRRNVQEDAILHSHDRENLKSYINFTWNKEEVRNLLLYQFTRRVIKLTAIIVVGYHCYQLHTKLYRTLFSQGSVHT